MAGGLVSELLNGAGRASNTVRAGNTVGARQSQQSLATRDGCDRRKASNRDSFDDISSDFLVPPVIEASGSWIRMTS
jgi:hypothetical protein